MSLAIDLSGIGSDIRIQGTRITAALDPKIGNGGKFRVEAEETCDPSERLHELTCPDLSRPVRTDAAISGFGRSYIFPSMDFVEVRTRMSPIDKARSYQLQYDQTVIDNKNFPEISLENESEDTLEASTLGISANYALQTLDGKPMHGEARSERLLYFQSQALLGGGTAVRFVSVRNKHNSWMVTLATQLHAIAKSKKNKFPGFTIDFTPKALEVNSKSLSTMVVEEVQGHFLDVAMESLSSLSARIGQPLAGAPTESCSVASLVADSHSENRRKINHGEAYEIATLFFKPGFYRELAEIC